MDLTEKIARIDFEILEKLGWYFGDIYEDVAQAQNIPTEEAEAWEKENYHVVIRVDSDLSTFYTTEKNGTHQYNEWLETGDDEKTLDDINQINPDDWWDIEDYNRGF